MGKPVARPYLCGSDNDSNSFVEGQVSCSKNSFGEDLPGTCEMMVSPWIPHLSYRKIFSALLETYKKDTI